MSIMGFHLSLNKKQISFFLFSILLSAILTFLMNSMNSKFEDEYCTNFLIIKFNNKYNSNILYPYSVIIFEDEMAGLTKNNDEIDYLDKKIFLKNNIDCDERIKDISKIIVGLNDNIKSKIKNVLVLLKTDRDKLPIEDQFMILDFDNMSFFEVITSNNNNFDNFKKKILIQFFVIIIILNIIFYIIKNTKIYIK